MKPPSCLRLLPAILFLAAAPWLHALTSPREHFGFAIGDDYQLATYTQTAAYFHKLAAESDRVKLVDIGPTEEGRRQYMLVVSSPGNLRNLERYKEISRQLARAEDLTEAQARALAAEGRPVVWIDGGLHATETVGTHQLIETVWNFASRTDAETLRILDKVIILFTHANPDGQELISSWYMRRPQPDKRVMDLAPRLYQKYIGHDNNRDFLMQNMKETTNIARQFYLEWLPQIVYNHHQPGPPGTIVAAPPYRDPFNYLYDPLIMTQIDALGAAMHSRWLAEGKGGTTMRRGSVFSTWWNGGLRTSVYFHNMIGLLTETVGSPTPMQIPLVPERQIPSGDLPLPIAPQLWHYRSSIEYSVTANYAVLNYAARQGDELLFNSYLMGRRAIIHGSEDHWTPSPGRVAAMRAAREKETKDKPDASTAGTTSMDSYNNRGIPAKYYEEYLRKPDLRDPRGYIIPADQEDFPTAVKFVNTLIKSGLTVHRATAAFIVAGRSYPAGSYVVKSAQAFRPFVLDAFEPQDHPNDFQYPGGPPVPPYDAAGWTLAYEMGVTFTRVLDGFNGPFERIPYGQLQSPPSAPPGDGAGWLVSHQTNNSFILANRLLRAGAAAYWFKSPVAGRPDFGPGTLYVPATEQSRPIVKQAAAELGLTVVPVSAQPAGDTLRLAPMRIALWDEYGGSISSGWIRWLFEQFEFGFDVVHPQQIDAGDLRAKYDVIVFPPGAIPMPKALNPAGDSEPPDYISRTPKAEDIPEEYRSWLGKLTEEKSIAPIRKFLEDGGTVIAIGSSTNIVYHLGLPVQNALQEPGRDGKLRSLPRDKYYVPGSVLSASVDHSQPLAWGLGERVDLYFDNSPVFKLAPEAVSRGVQPVVWFSSDHPLRSGWAWGQHYLDQGIQAVSANYGAGHVCLLAPEVTFRAQTHGTFKLLFNGLFLSTAR